MGASDDGRVSDELRSLRRIATVVLIVLAISLALQLYSFVRMHTFSVRASGAADLEMTSPSWQSVRRAMDRGDFDYAWRMASDLAKQNEDYYYAHSYLGSIYLAMGELEQAEQSYARAYELFPIEANQKALEAVRAVLQKGGALETR